MRGCFGQFSGMMSTTYRMHFRGLMSISFRSMFSCSFIQQLMSTDSETGADSEACLATNLQSDLATNSMRLVEKHRVITGQRWQWTKHCSFHWKKWQHICLAGFWKMGWSPKSTKHLPLRPLGSALALLVAHGGLPRDQFAKHRSSIAA